MRGDQKKVITNENDILSYKTKDKIYIPENYKSNLFSYKINGDFITIITNQNCRTQYSTTYCTCYYYNYKNNLMSEGYECNTNNSNPSIAYTSITSDINDSKYIRDLYIQDKGVILVVIILGILFAILLTKERHSL